MLYTNAYFVEIFVQIFLSNNKVSKIDCTKTVFSTRILYSKLFSDFKYLVIDVLNLFLTKLFISRR